MPVLANVLNFGVNLTTTEIPAKIKIVHLITRLELGGAQLNTLYTVEHLDSQRYEVVLACGEGGHLDEKARALSSRQLPVHLRFIPDLVREIHPVKDLTAFFQIYSFLIEERPQIIHTHSSKAGILGRAAAWLAGVPIIIHTFHGFAFNRDQHRIMRWFYIFLEKCAARISTGLVFVSKVNQKEAEDEVVGNPSQYRLILIRSGIKLGRFPARIESKEQKKRSIGARMHQPLIVTIANFKRQKSPLDFLEVAARVLKVFPEVSFAFVGNGEGSFATTMQAKVISLGLAGKVHLLGWREDAAEILAAADIFILTSRWEGLPRALVEAMKSGLPCVCYSVDGVTDILRNGENGFLIPPGNLDEMVDKICLLLKDKALREMSAKNALETIGPEFDIDYMVRQQEELYQELAARHISQ